MAVSVRNAEIGTEHSNSTDKKIDGRKIDGRKISNLKACALPLGFLAAERQLSGFAHPCLTTPNSNCVEALGAGVQFDNVSVQRLVVRFYRRPIMHGFAPNTSGLQRRSHILVNLLGHFD
jgi:hypothetical protein